LPKLCLHVALSPLVGNESGLITVQEFGGISI
jgi:hypothetical protein